MAKIIYIDKIKSYKEKFMAEMEMDINKSYAAAVERSKKLEEDLVKNPKKYRVLTGDRPTGRLHIGHYLVHYRTVFVLQN